MSLPPLNNFQTNNFQYVPPPQPVPNIQQNGVTAINPYSNPTNYSVVQSPPMQFNTMDPTQMAQMQQQYVSQIQASQQTTTAPEYDVSSPSSINEMLKSFSAESNKLIEEAKAEKAKEAQQQKQFQQTTTQVAQVPQQGFTTGAISSQVPNQMSNQMNNSVGMQNQQVANNPQVNTAQAQNTAPKVGQSDGQGNILVSDPTTGKLGWVPEEQLLAMYQGGQENRGKIQLPNGTWVDKATLAIAIEKLRARIQLKELVSEGKITKEEADRAGLGQDLSGILGNSQLDKNKASLARMKEAASGRADASMEKLGGSSPFANFSPSGGEATG